VVIVNHQLSPRAGTSTPPFARPNEYQFLSSQPEPAVKQEPTMFVRSEGKPKKARLSVCLRGHISRADLTKQAIYDVSHPSASPHTAATSIFGSYCRRASLPHPASGLWSSDITRAGSEFDAI